MNLKTAEVEARMAHFQKECREKGIKLTPQRLEIFRSLATSTAHPDAETVLGSVRERFPNVSLDTVYRTLWLFSDLGLVRTLGPRRERARFDGETRPHQHYVCKQCQQVWDLHSSSEPSADLPKHARAYGSVETVHLEIQGICNKCAQANQSKSLPSGDTN